MRWHSQKSTTYRMRWLIAWTTVLKRHKPASGVQMPVLMRVKRWLAAFVSAEMLRTSRRFMPGLWREIQAITQNSRISVRMPVKSVPRSVPSTITNTVKCVLRSSKSVQRRAGTWRLHKHNELPRVFEHDPLSRCRRTAPDPHFVSHRTLRERLSFNVTTMTIPILGTRAGQITRTGEES